MLAALLILQSFHVLFLALHDWVPLGRLNNLAAVHAENSSGALTRATLISTLPFAWGLAWSLYALGHGAPGWLRGWLWWSYLILFAGEVWAWWVPYFFGTSPERVARYRTMFGSNAAFLPERHGIRPDALHVTLHLATVAILLILRVTTF